MRLWSCVQYPKVSDTTSLEWAQAEMDKPFICVFFSLCMFVISIFADRLYSHWSNRINSFRVIKIVGIHFVQMPLPLHLLRCTFEPRIVYAMDTDKITPKYRFPKAIILHVQCRVTWSSSGRIRTKTNEKV